MQEHCILFGAFLQLWRAPCESFPLYPADVVHDIYGFVCNRLPLTSKGRSYLVIVSESFNTLLNSICYCLMKDLCICLHQAYWPIIVFFRNIPVYFYVKTMLAS